MEGVHHTRNGGIFQQMAPKIGQFVSFNLVMVSGSSVSHEKKLHLWLEWEWMPTACGWGDQSIYLHHSGPSPENGVDRPEHQHGRCGFASFPVFSYLP